MAHNEQTKKTSGPSGFGPGGNTGSGEKAKDFNKTVRQLIEYCRNYLPWIILALILACLGSIFSILGPDKLGEVTELITAGLMSGIDLEAVANIGVLLIALYGTSALFSYIQGFIMATITQQVSKSMRTDLSEKINRLPLKYFDTTSHGDVLSRVTNDVDTIGQSLNNSIGTLVSSITSFVGALIMMFITNWIMALSAIAATFIGFFLMILIMSLSQKHFDTQQQQLGAMNGHIEEIYSGHTVVKAYNGEVNAEKTFDGINDKLFSSAWKSQFISGLMMPIMSFIGNLGYVVVCVVGAALAINGTISFGVIVSFMVYIRLFTNPLSQIAQAATSLQSTAAAAERVFDFLNETELSDETDKVKVLQTAEGNVVFDHVSFGYTDDKMVIHDFSAQAKAGEKIAIVGPTGAGKTTLVNLLMKFYEINHGDILIDGVSIHDLTRSNVHEQFCMVLQDTWLFEGTIKENIIYAKKGVSDEQVIDACKTVGLHHYIMSLPNKYDTILNDKASLSTGQKQLLTIARAMIDDAPMLILDEATSSIDTRTEKQIQEAMDLLTIGRTSFVIAHRLSTIKNANLILVMNEGNIVEVGTHDNLLAKDGFYAGLYNSQFEVA